MRKLSTFLFFLCISFSSFSQSSSINPAFIKYLDDLHAGKISHTDGQGHYLGAVPPLKLLYTSPVQYHPLTLTSSFPSVYDLRTLGLVTSVKDQGGCGSCWTFGTYGSMESHWKVMGFSDYDLSENNLKDCAGFDLGPCDGGNSWMSISYLTRFSGSYLETQDPYADYPESCLNLGNTQTSFEFDARFLPNNQNLIKQTLMTYGATYTAFYWDGSNYNGSNYTYYYSGTNSANHAVTIIGWNDTITTAGGQGAWLIKNSWGAGWGDNGYFYISYNDSQVNSEASYYPNRHSKSTTFTQYNYAPLGEVIDTGFSSPTAYAVVKFVSTSAYPVIRISSWVASGNGTMDLKVYSNFNGTTLSGLLDSVTNISTPLNGFYSVDLPVPLNIPVGNAFYIEAKYYTPGYNMPIPVEAVHENWSSEAVILSGVGWISPDGNTWTAIGSNTSAPYNLCILAYAADEPVAPVTTAGSVTACPGSAITIPLTVTNFTNITGLSLRLDYDASMLTYASFSNVNAVLSGLTVTDSLVSGTIHKLMLKWQGTSAQTIASAGLIADLQFTYISGSPILSFNNINDYGWDCRYFDSQRSPLFDNPTATYYVNSQITAATPPSPTIAGPASSCLNSTGNVYTTQTGMTNYLWNVSSGGTITAGGTTSSNTATVKWNSTGSQWVSTNYKNSYGCSAANATVYPVTVNPLPVPIIAGNNSVCAGTTGVVYTTQAGMTNYTWGVSSGGTITAGGSSTSNTITITWHTAGTQSVTVNYVNSSGCTASAPATYQVTVNPLPQPTLTGLTSICAGIAGNVYTTQTGMSNYIWNVSSGGTITAGGTSASNTVTVTWNTAGTQSVTVNYSNLNGCTGAAPANVQVTVNPLPQPTLTGPTSMCAGTTGNVYTTQAGMSNYIWNISSGGVITAGGSAVSNTVTVTWITAGARYVSVNYNNSIGCHAISPVALNVTVNALPVPTITGSSGLCPGIAGTYTTESGKTNYTWTVSSGAIIVTGGGTANNSITVKWTALGSQWIRVLYTDPDGCTATTYTQFNITVGQLPAPVITGPNTVCQGSPGNVYTTQSGMTNYTWTPSAGGIITAGAGTNAITVTWTGSGAQWVRVNYSEGGGCTAPSPTQFNVTVKVAPVPSISGVFTVCANTTAAYSTSAGMTNYIWTVSAGGTITSGQGTKQVNVHWSTPGTNTISVTYTVSSGCPVANPTVKTVTVNALPMPTITGPTTPCVGAYVYYSTETGMTNYSWALGGSGGIIYSGFNSHQIAVKWVLPGAKTVSVNYTTPAGCRASVSAVLNVTAITCPDIVSGIDTSHSAAGFSIYPNPNNGKFTALIQCECQDNCLLDVFNMMGVKVFELTNLNIESSIEVPIDLQNLPDGIYIVIFRTSDQYIMRKIVINK
jgi:C1A family cysteine protease